MRVLWQRAKTLLKASISPVPSSSASWTPPQRLSTGQGEQGAAPGKSGTMALPISRGSHAVCTDSSLFLAVSLISGVKITANSSWIFKGRDLLLGMPLDLLSGCSLPPPILLDFLTVNQQPQTLCCLEKGEGGLKGSLSKWASVQSQGVSLSLGESSSWQCSQELWVILPSLY